MSKAKVVPPLTELSNGLALQAIQNIGKNKFTVFATLDVDHQESLTNFRILGHELEKAYRQGEEVAQTKLSEASPEFLDAAQRSGAIITGKPDGSEPITVVFSCEAWRMFDRAVSIKNRAFDEWYAKTEWVSKEARIYPKSMLGMLGVHRADAIHAEVERLRGLLVKAQDSTAYTPEDVKLMDFLTSRASINFDDENCLLRFEVPATFEGANSLREIVRTAMQESEARDG